MILYSLKYFTKVFEPHGLLSTIFVRGSTFFPLYFGSYLVLRRGLLVWEDGKVSFKIHRSIEIPEMIGPIAYLLGIPASLEHIYHVFHGSMLRKYGPDSAHLLGIPYV